MGPHFRGNIGKENPVSLDLLLGAKAQVYPLVGFFHWFWNGSDWNIAVTNSVN